MYLKWLHVYIYIFVLVQSLSVTAGNIVIHVYTAVVHLAMYRVNEGATAAS
jgi:hypothetical protein